MDTLPLPVRSLIADRRIRDDPAGIGDGRLRRVLLTVTRGSPNLVDPGSGRVDSIRIRIVVQNAHLRAIRIRGTEYTARRALLPCETRIGRIHGIGLPATHISGQLPYDRVRFVMGYLISIARLIDVEIALGLVQCNAENYVRHGLHPSVLMRGTMGGPRRLDLLSLPVGRHLAPRSIRASAKRLPVAVDFWCATA